MYKIYVSTRARYVKLAVEFQCPCVFEVGRIYELGSPDEYDKPATIPPGPNPRHSIIVMTMEVIHQAVMIARFAMPYGSAANDWLKVTPSTRSHPLTYKIGFTPRWGRNKAADQSELTNEDPLILGWRGASL